MYHHVCLFMSITDSSLRVDPNATGGEVKTDIHNETCIFMFIYIYIYIYVYVHIYIYACVNM